MGVHPGRGKNLSGWGRWGGWGGGGGVVRGGVKGVRGSLTEGEG